MIPNQMTKTASKIRFKAKLLRPAESDPESIRGWTFLILPKNASAKLPSRGMTAIEGSINDFPFQATLEPDGQKSHWLKVDRKLRERAGANAGDVVTLEIAPAAKDTGTHRAGRSAESSRGCRPEDARVMVGHHAQRTPRLDPLDHLRQTRRDARASDQECVLHARCRQATRLLLRPLRVLQ